MTTLLVIVNMVVALLLVYQAGKLATMIEYDRDIFNIKPDMMIYVYWFVDIVLAAYLIVAIFGQGVQIGGSQ